MTRWREKISGPWLFAWLGAVVCASAARAEDGYRPPAVGTVMPYTIEGSFGQARGERKFSTTFKGKLEIIAFGDEAAPRYAIVQTEGKVSPFGTQSDITFFRTWQGEVVKDAASAAGAETLGGRTVHALLFPSGMARKGLAEGRREVPVVTLFSPMPTKLACDVTVETKEDTIRVVRAKAKDEATAGAPLTPAGAALLGQKPRDWREEFVLGKEDGQLREAQVSIEEALAAGKETVVLTMRITAKVGERRELSADQVAAVAADGERLQALSRLPSGPAGELARLLAADRDSLSAQKQRLSAVRKQAAELEKFSEERKDSSLALAVPAVRNKLKRIEDQIERQIEETELVATMKGKPAPHFVLKDLDGHEVNSTEFIRGKVALVSFWGVACGPCRREAPHLTALYEKYKDDGLVVLAVNGYDEPREVVADFMKDEALTHPVVLMGGTVAREQYHVRGFPTIYWIDHEGNVVDRDVGFGPGKEKLLMKQIEKLVSARNGKPPTDRPYKLPVALDRSKTSDKESERVGKPATKDSP